MTDARDPFPPLEPIHPDLLAYAKQTTDFAEMEREIVEMMRTGSGQSLDGLIEELEEKVRQSS
jgi:hypothetical protein